jgi:hypothetical protein
LEVVVEVEEYRTNGCDEDPVDDAYAFWRPGALVQDVCERVPGGAQLTGNVQLACLCGEEGVEVEGMGVGVESGEDSRKERVIVDDEFDGRRGGEGISEETDVI